MTPKTSTADLGGFDQFDLDPAIHRGIADAGFSEPRPIQIRAVPPALAGRDVLGLAQTGTGKTAAFALPILQRLVTSRKAARDPRVLIVAPTRELAQQISAELQLLGKHLPLQTLTLYGGVSAHHQVVALRRGVDVLIACPGRLLDLHSQRLVRLDKVEMLVLDEADHMFDMGFLPAIRGASSRALPARSVRTCSISATMPRGDPEDWRTEVLERTPAVAELREHRAPPETDRARASIRSWPRTTSSTCCSIS